MQNLSDNLRIYSSARNLIRNCVGRGVGMVKVRNPISDVERLHSHNKSYSRQWLASHSQILFWTVIGFTVTNFTWALLDFTVTNVIWALIDFTVIKPNLDTGFTVTNPICALIDFTVIKTNLGSDWLYSDKCYWALIGSKVKNHNLGSGTFKNSIEDSVKPPCVVKKCIFTHLNRTLTPTHPWKANRI